jgi:DNA-binding transcriptional LysR family regulator
MVDVSSRLLHYFVAVAEELHFTRAAERLYIAQPALSKAIRRLESNLELALFERDRHGVTLTAAGQALLPGARRILAELATGLDEAQAAHRAEGHVLRVSYHSSLGSDLQQPITARFAQLRPGWRVELRVADWSDPAGAVLSGTCDAGLLRLPLHGQEKLDTCTLRMDSRWIAIPIGHRLASRSAIQLQDLQDEEFVALPTASGPFREFWLALDEFERPPAIGAEASNADDFLEAIASGRGVGMLAETSTRVHTRPDVTYRLVTDASPSQLVVAYRKGSTDPVVSDFVLACTQSVPPATPSNQPVASTTAMSYNC